MFCFNATKILKELDPLEREKHVVKRRHEIMTATAAKQKLCLGCALMQAHCVCQKLSAMAFEESAARFLVHMHVKEKYRSSNTGKVLERIFSAPVCIDSDGHDMQKMQQLIDENLKSCLVLFPSENSKTVEELRQEDPSLIPANPMILVPDGTWKQAKRLQRNFPESIRRVKIEPKTLSKFLCRTQTQADRVCTVEAVSMLLEDLGMQREAELALEGLKVVQSAYNMQTFHNEVRPDDRMKKKPKLMIS